MKPACTLPYTQPDVPLKTPCCVMVCMQRTIGRQGDWLEAAFFGGTSAAPSSTGAARFSRSSSNHRAGGGAAVGAPGGSGADDDVLLASWPGEEVLVPSDPSWVQVDRCMGRGWMPRGQTMVVCTCLCYN